IRAFVFADRLQNGLEITSKGSDPTHAGNASGHHERRSSSTVAFAPPKPKEFEITRRALTLRILLATMSSGNSDGAKLMVAAINSSRSATQQNAPSIAPAAPRACPVMLLVLLTGALGQSSRMARASLESFSGVPVPCALM